MKLSLAHVATIVLALASTGCWCSGVEDSVWSENYEGVFADEELQTLREGETTDEARCESACRALVMDEPTGGSPEIDEVVWCSATGDDEDIVDPWDPAHVEVTVTCQVDFREPGVCMGGRRPMGHHELAQTCASIGLYFAELAHLEAASIRAFVELAEWLERRSAPRELIERCRAAADDEVVHAAAMTEQARRAGVEPATPSADSPVDDLLAVALHNAVEGCVHEAFAALIAAHQARSCDDPELRELFARIADDELRHGQLAWDLHAWLLERLDDGDRARVEAAQHEALARLASTTRSNATRTPADVGWPSPAVAAGMAERFAALVHPLAVAA
ncbi:ferritin-like domain-containing protein [Nannocystaceae bacterium ST9]